MKAIPCPELPVPREMKLQVREEAWKGAYTTKMNETFSEIDSELRSVESSREGTLTY